MVWLPVGVALAALASLKDAIFGPRRRRSFSLQSKHVFITGASSGIGYALAKQALLQGSYVTLSARNKQKLEEAVENLLQEKICDPDRINHMVADVTDYNAITLAVKEAFQWRPIDVLICNAGLARGGYFDEMPIQALETVVQTNLLGTIYTAHAGIPLMKKYKHEHPVSIVFMCSIAAVSFIYGNAVYTATKHAIKGLAETLQLELLPYNIQVNVICPSWTNTNLLAEVDNTDFSEMHEKLTLYDRNQTSTPENVAVWALDAVKNDKFMATDFDYYPLLVAGRGFTAPSSFLTTLFEALLLPFLRILSWPFTIRMRNIVMDQHKKEAMSEIDQSIQSKSS